MKKTLYKKVLVAALVVLSLGQLLLWSPSPAAAAPQASDPFAQTEPSGGTCDPKQGATRFLGLPFWYEYLDGERGANNACRPTVKKPADVWLVVAALFGILLRFAAIATVIFIIYGGFKYITSRGQPGGIAAGKDIITNAILGLVFTIVSAQFLGSIANRFSGAPSTSFGLPQVSGNEGAVATALSIAMQLAAALAILFVAWGGITFARSDGDPNTIKEAKNTVLYALVGLVIAILAQAIVYFVFERLD